MNVVSKVWFSYILDLIFIKSEYNYCVFKLFDDLSWIIFLYIGERFIEKVRRWLKRSKPYFGAFDMTNFNSTN